MDVYRDAPVDSPAPSTYNHAPILALYDFLDQKLPAYSYTYTSCAMGTLPEEDEEYDDEDGDDKIVISPMTSNPQHSRNSSSTTPHQFDEPHEAKAYAAAIFDNLDRLAAQDAECQPDRTQAPQLAPRSKSSPAALPQTAAPRRPNWQTIRYQSLPGRTDKTKLVAWVTGWSAAVAELGDETYCACADTTAPLADFDRAPPSSATKVKKKRSFKHTAAQAKQNRRDYQVMVDTNSANTMSRSSSGGDAEKRGDVPAAVVATAVLAPPPTPPKKQGDSAVCRNCARRPSPTVTPDEDFIIVTGTSKIVLRWKLVWKSFFARKHKAGIPTSSTEQPVLQWEGQVTAQQQQEQGFEEEEEEEDADLDQLSRSSKGLRRPGEDIAERQARLRRAQRLLQGPAAAGPPPRV